MIVMDGKPVGTHPLVIRLLKGVYNLRPTIPRYTDTWDVNIVFKLLKTMSPVRDLTLKDLTFKLVMLLSLVTGHRGQTFHLLRIDCMTVGKSTYTFQFLQPLKNCKASGRVKPLLKLKAYAPDRRLCVVTVLKEYLHRTCPLRGHHVKLLISYRKPFAPVSRDTISRWVRMMMCRAGLDINKYAPHSCRAATVAAAKNANIPVVEIMKRVGWASAQVFATYYEKPLQKNDKGLLLDV